MYRRRLREPRLGRGGELFVISDAVSSSHTLDRGAVCSGVCVVCQGANVRD